MDIFVNRDVLFMAVSRAALVTDATSPMPVIGCVQLAAHGRVLRVSATDLYMSSDESVEAEVAEPGAVTLPANELLNILARVSRGPVQLKGDGDVHIHPVGQSLTYLLSGHSGDGVPQMPETPAGPWATLDGDSVLDGFRSVVSCASNRRASNANAVSWTSDQTGTIYVATDGYRIGVARRGPVTPVTFSALVPLDAVRALVIGRERNETGSLPPWLSRGPVEVAVHWDAVCERLFLRNEGRVFCVRLSKAAFPDYANAIPEGFATSVVANSRSLLRTIRSVTAATFPESPGALLTVNPGHIRVAYNSKTVTSSDEVLVKYHGAPSPTIGLDPELITEALSEFYGEVLVGINGKEDPVVFSSVESADVDTNKYIIMPMRT